MFTGAEIKDWIIIVAGNIFIAILVVRMVSHYAKREWGELITNLLVAIFIAWIVYSTDTFISFLKWCVSKVSGNGDTGASGALDTIHAGLLTAGAHSPQLVGMITAGVI